MPPRGAQRGVPTRLHPGSAGTERPEPPAGCEALEPSRHRPEGRRGLGGAGKLWDASKAGTKVPSGSLKTRVFYYFASLLIKGQASEMQIIPPAQDSSAICHAGKICIANLSKYNLPESYSEYCFD